MLVVPLATRSGRRATAAGACCSMGSARGACAIRPRSCACGCGGAWRARARRARPGGALEPGVPPCFRRVSSSPGSRGVGGASAARSRRRCAGRCCPGARRFASRPALSRREFSRCHVNLECLHAPPDGDDNNCISPLHAGCDDAVANARVGALREALFVWNASMAAGEVTGWEDVDSAVMTISATGLAGPEGMGRQSPRQARAAVDAVGDHVATRGGERERVLRHLAAGRGSRSGAALLSEMRRCGRVMCCLHVRRA